jgi:hypothetical protein
MKKAKVPTRKTRQGSSTTDIVFITLVIVLLGCGIWWIIKTIGQSGQQYSKALIKTSDSADTMKCQMNLRSIWQCLQVYTVSEGRYPESGQAFRQVCGDLRLMHCPDPNGGNYVYIPPKRVDDTALRVLVYEPNAVHDEQCNALMSDGQIGQIPPAELNAMLVQMRRQPR